MADGVSYPDIQRPNYFNSQLLYESDFKDEQAYHRDMRLFHNRSLHTWGIVQGLDVQKSADNKSITVSRGMAIDNQGREIVLAKDATPKDWPQLQLNQTKDVYVTIRYHSKPDENTKLPDILGVEAAYRRQKEIPTIEIADASPAPDGTAIVLAKLKLDPAGVITDIDKTPPTRSRAAGSVIDPATELTVRNLLVEGKVGIGAPSPGANLDVGGKRDTSGQVSLQLRSGNQSANYNSNQITLGYSNTAEYRHAIKTRHNGTGRSGNAIDFYVWKYLSATEKDDTATIGTLHTMTLDGGNVGIGTTSPAATLQIGNTIDQRGNYDHSSTRLLVRAKDHNGGKTPAPPQSVLALVREGVATEAFGNMVDFRLGRWEYPSGTPSRSQLDIYLTEDAFVPKHVMALRGNGNVGIGTASPGAKLEVAVVGDDGTTKPLAIGKGATNYLTILNDGKVGIGATDPTTDLQFRNVARDSKVLISRKAAKDHDAGNVPSELSLGIYDGAFGGVRIITERKMPSNDGSNLYICFDTYTAWESVGERMRIAPSGFVGIGTTSPAAKLEVKGGQTILEQQAWQNVDYASNWTRYEDQNKYNPTQYFKDSQGIVHLRGMIKDGTISADNAAFTLPEGYRPQYRQLHVVCTSDNAVGRVDVLSNGKVVVVSGSKAWVSLDSISFRAG